MIRLSSIHNLRPKGLHHNILGLTLSVPSPIFDFADIVKPGLCLVSLHYTYKALAYIVSRNDDSRLKESITAPISCVATIAGALARKPAQNQDSMIWGPQ